MSWFAELAGASQGALHAAGANTSVADVFDKVRDYTEKPDDDKLVKGAIDGMLASLDPHSTYFRSQGPAAFQSSMKGEELGGLGLEVIDGGRPSQSRQPESTTRQLRGPLMSGDLVTRINGQGIDAERGGEQIGRCRKVERAARRAGLPQRAAQENMPTTIHPRAVSHTSESGDIGYITNRPLQPGSL